jgi:hypothetical protein
MSERVLKEAIDMVAAMGWHALTGGKEGTGAADSGLVERCIAALSSLQAKGKGKLLPEEKVALSAAVSSLQLNYVKVFSERRLHELLSFLKTAALSGDWADVFVVAKTNKFFLNALRTLEEVVKEEHREEVSRVRREVEKEVGGVGELDEMAKLLYFLSGTFPSLALKAMEEILELCGEEMTGDERRAFEERIKALREKEGEER